MEFLFWCLLFYSSSISLIDGTRRHVIIHPKLFRLDTDEKIVINLHGYPGVTVDITARIRHPRTLEENIHEQTNIGTDSSPMFTLKVPSKWLQHNYEVQSLRLELLVTIIFHKNAYPEIREEIRVGVTGERDSIFVMSDRPIYRPGELVKIRIAALDGRMLPRNIPEVNVSIETKDGIAIWKDKRKKRISDLFIDAEYKIPLGAPLDTYHIVVTVSSQGHLSRGIAVFIVDKYVLPTFSVRMTIDRNTVAPNEAITGHFTALYTYGKNVTGKYSYSATLHVPDNLPEKIFSYPSDPIRDSPGIMKGTSAGRGSFTVTTNHIPPHEWQTLISKRATISITLSVMGDAEGVIEKETVDGILITDTNVRIDLSQTSKYFIPGVDHDLNVVFRDVTNAPIRMRGRISVTENGREIYQENIRDQENMAIPITTRSNEVQKELTVTAGNATEVITLSAGDTTHGYLKILGPRNAQIGANIMLHFLSRNRPGKIHYLVVSRGNIIESNFNENNMKRLRITRKMSPKIRVVAYFFNNGHMVSDSKSIEVEEICTGQDLSVSLSRENEEVLDIDIEGPIQAEVALRAIDKAAFLLNHNGSIDRKHMFEKMKEADMGCTSGGGSKAVDVFMNSGLGMKSNLLLTPEERSLDCSQDLQESLSRAKRSPTQNTQENEVELKRCFADGRKENLANLPCHKRRNLLLRYYAKSILQECVQEFLSGCVMGERIREISDHIRKYGRTNTFIFDDESHHSLEKRYPRSEEERWLWQKVEIGMDGKFTQTHSYPSSITSYDIDAISLHETEGMCIAKAVEMIIIKNTFVKLFLPYSVKYMEEIEIRGAIFHYGNEEVSVALQIKLDKNLCSKASQGRWHSQGNFTIKPNATASFGLAAVPINIPRKKHSVIEAEICSLQTGTLIDSIKRDLRIEETGELEDFSGSFPLDPNDWTGTVTVDLPFPGDNIVPSSRKCFIYGFMSFLGPLVEFNPIDETPKNLVKSLRTPGGCGEQNMMKVGPNVFIFKYQQIENMALTKDKIKNYIEDGYVIQLSHRNDRKWSVYKSSPPNVWLNAYVNKVFSHAKEIWQEMDMNPICDSLQWLTEQQEPSGKFSMADRDAYWIRGAGDGALTAFVLISIAEVEIYCNPQLNGHVSQMRDNAAQYLESVRNRPGVIPNTYAEAVITYALSLHNPAGVVVQMIERLDVQTIEDGDGIHWLSTGTSIAIETTAYALMAHIKLASAQISHGFAIREKINKMARWIVRQQNHNGGLLDSQSTAVGIQSLATYAKWIDHLEPYLPNPHLNMTITVPGKDWSTIFTLDRDYMHYRKSLEITKKVMEHQQFKISNLEGKGRGTLSYRCMYRTISTAPVCDYDIQITTRLKEREFTLLLNISKLSPINNEERQMGIIEVSLMSGYTANEDTLNAILKGDEGVVDGIIDRYEISPTKVTLYVDVIEQDEPLQFGFKLIRSLTITNPNPAQIHVYNYYDPEQSQCTKFYSEPHTSPLSQKYCPKNGNSGQGELCKCMAGECPHCRYLSDRLNNTCATSENCKENKSKFNLWSSVCQSRYTFVIKLQEIEEMPLFSKLTAQINNLTFYRDMEINKSRIENSLKTFILRDDCLKKCEDESSVAKGYFKVNSSYLIRGKAADTKTLPSGEIDYTFYLDQDSYIERWLPYNDCRGWKSWKVKGKESKKEAKIKRRRKLCKLQDRLSREVELGCDNSLRDGY